MTLVSENLRTDIVPLKREKHRKTPWGLMLTANDFWDSERTKIKLLWLTENAKCVQNESRKGLHAGELCWCPQSIPDFCLLSYFVAEQKQRLKWQTWLTASKSWTRLGLFCFFLLLPKALFVEIYRGDLCNAHKGRDDWAAFLFSFPPCSCCRGTNVPVRGTMDCAAVTCQKRGALPQKKKNKTQLPASRSHTYAHIHAHMHTFSLLV